MCDECLRRQQEWHEERLNDALGRADDGERPCHSCYEIKNVVEDFTGDNVMCDECSDKSRLYQRKRRKCFKSLLQEEEATHPSPYPSTFTPRDIVADGNCQFRAIADQLYDNQDRHREVREMVIRELVSNRISYIEPLIHLRSVEGIQSEDADILWDTYIDELCRGPISDTSLGWGDSITLIAAARALGVDIRVFGRSVGPSGHVISSGSRTANSVGMLNIFRDGHHYLSLREEEEDFKEEEATQPSPYPSTFTPRDIVADGNCQFRAIADQLYDNQDRHGEVRQAVIYELENNRERYIDDLVILRVADRAAYEAATGIQLQVDVYQAGMREAMWNAYIAELRAGPDTSNTSYGWGDDITLRAAANSYSVRIQVYGGSGILVENLNGTAEITLNVFCENSHYTSLRQSTEEEDDVEN